MEKQKIIRLRKKGISIREIKKQVNVSKSTISLWCKNIELTQKQQKTLDINKIDGLKLASINAKKSKNTKRIDEENYYLKLGTYQVGKLNNREKFITGVALYMAEGSKTGEGVEFTNSDPESIRFMAKWFVDYCGIKIDRIKCSLWLHKNLNEDEAKQYWSKLIHIPLSNFGKTYFAEIKNSKKITRKNYHPYGIIKIRFYDVKKLRLIKGWIRGILSA